MCLEIVYSTVRDRKREGIGWKVFQIKNGNLYGDCVVGRRRIGVWLKSRDNKSASYPLGFHILHTRREARIWKSPGEKVRKVRFRDVLAEGTQYKWGELLSHNLRVIVAKEMMILPK